MSAPDIIPIDGLTERERKALWTLRTVAFSGRTAAGHYNKFVQQLASRKAFELEQRALTREETSAKVQTRSTGTRRRDEWV